MRLTHKIVFDRIKLILLFAFLSTTAIQAQTTDLEVQFIGTPPTRVAIGEAFAIQAQVIHVGASAPVVGETVTATLELIAPDGIVISTYVQSWNGFANPPGISSVLDNDSTAAQQVILQMPWTEASKINYGPDFTPFTNDDASWTVSVRVSSPSLETNLSNNTVTHSIFVDTPDLRVDSNPQIRAKHPQTGQLTTNLFPDSRLEVSGTITNVGNAITQPGARFTVEARLFEGSVTSNLFIPRSLALDYERIILPASDGSTEPTVLVNGSVPYTITNLNLPADAEGNFTIQIIADVPDQDNLYPPPGNVVEELEEFDNNHQIITFTVDPGSPEIQLNPSSYEGDIGTFNGLDPIRIAFAVRNNGTGAVQPTDDFTVRVALSTNDSFSNDDFILREFDLSGDALGTNLLPNETINLDWIQQLPDNFEGDYYMVVNIESPQDQTNTISFSNTPIITLVSLNEGNTELISSTTNTTFERPSTSNDGMIVAYEAVQSSGIKHVYYKNLKTGIERPISIGSEGNSIRPIVSGDGSTIVFHSLNGTLVPGDENNHEDVFIFDVETEQITRATNFIQNQEGNGGSFYPSVNSDGSLVVFESEASNISNVNSNGREIFMWDRSIGTFGEITPLTVGNGASFDAAVSDSGDRIVFTSESTDLIAGDNNGVADIFLFDTNTAQLIRINLNSLGSEANGGRSDQAKISGDGKTVVFRSLATNLVTGKGISNLSIETSGVGYYGNPTIVVNDPFGNGEGAELAFTSGAIDLYGQIRPGGIEIINSGNNYSDPQVTIIPDPNFPAPVQVASIKAHLTHPLGEIYSVNVDALLSNDFSSIKRISENAEGVGGDMPSREPDVSYDGKSIVYSTQASNLLGNQVERADGKVFYNQPVRQARAQAVLVGGIGEIEVLASGAGYSNGFLSVNDVSGGGSGAIASYDVDSFGRISSITMVNPGSNYNLATTVVQVDNPRGGSGFIAGALRFAKETGIGGARVGGGKVHRVEMIEHGMNYQTVASSSLGLQSLIAIDGDGVDADNDGKPDAKLNPDRIKIDSKGGIYLEQVFDISVTSTSSLLATTLGIEDANKSIFINFANSDSLPFTIGINNRSLSQIRDKITEVIWQQWDLNNSSTIYDGPIVEGNATGGTTFTLRALSGKVAIDNSSSIQVSTRSNMLFSGAGFTRATPYIAPPPTIHGFSEISSQTTVESNDDGRQVYAAQTDFLTDDVYLYNADTGANERVSTSTFGFPVNYINSTTASMPSNRFAAISGDGRNVYFSSDSSGGGGLAFDNTNQSSIDNDGLRDIYVRDLKSIEIPTGTNSNETQLSMTLLHPVPGVVETFALGANIPIFGETNVDERKVEKVEFYVNGKLVYSESKDDRMVGEAKYSLYSLKTSSRKTYNEETGLYTDSPGGNITEGYTPTEEGNYTVRMVAYPVGSNTPSSSLIGKFTITKNGASQLPGLILRNPYADDFFTSTSRVVIFGNGWDVDGDYKSTQFYVNGANVILQFKQQPLPGDTIEIEGDETNRQLLTIEFGNDVIIGPNLSTTIQNLTTFLQTFFPSARDFRGNTVLINSSKSFELLINHNAPQRFVTQVLQTVYRPTGESPQTFPFTNTWTPGLPGFYNIHATGIDTSGNLVSSACRLVTATTGTNPPEIKIIAPNELAESNFNNDLNITNGVVNVGIYKIDVQGSGYEILPDVSVVGDGIGAKAIATLTENGEINSIEVISGGFGYTYAKLLISPRIRSLLDGAAPIVYPVFRTEVSQTVPVPLFRTTSVPNPLFNPNAQVGPQNQPNIQMQVPVNIPGTNIQASTYDIVRERKLVDVRVISLGNKLRQEPNHSIITDQNESSVQLNTSFIAMEGRFDSFQVPATPQIVASSAIIQFENTGLNLGTVTLKADAQAHNDSTLLYVLFYVDGKMIDSDSQAPFIADWQPDRPGFFSIWSVAVDDRGNKYCSDPLTIRAIPFGSPESKIITPLGTTGDPVKVSLGSRIPLVADARAQVGDVNDTNPSGVTFTISNGDTIVATQQGSTSRFEGTWVPTNPGVYKIYADVDDSHQQRSLSEPTIVEVVTNGSLFGGGGSLSPKVSMVYPQTRNLSEEALDPQNLFIPNFGDDITFIGSGSTTYTRALSNRSIIVPNDESLGDYAYTSTSKIRLFARAGDFDGDLVGVQFYVNGTQGSIQLRDIPINGTFIKISDGMSLNAPEYRLEFNATQTPTSLPLAQNWDPNDTIYISLKSTRAENANELFNYLESLRTDLSVQVTPIPFSFFGNFYTIRLKFQDTRYATLESGAPNDLNFQNTHHARVFVQLLPEVLRGDTLSPWSHPYGAMWTPGLDGTYTIQARARDNSGNFAWSKAVTVTSTTGSTPPKTEILNPNTVTHATAAVNVVGGIESVKINKAGVGYLENPEVEAVEDLPPWNDYSNGFKEEGNETGPGPGGESLFADGLDNEGMITGVGVKKAGNHFNKPTVYVRSKLNSVTNGKHAIAEADLYLFFIKTEQVQQIHVRNGGSGYAYPPKVRIIGDGFGAEGKAYIDSNPIGNNGKPNPNFGKVTHIEVVSSGTGYTETPIVELYGGFGLDRVLIEANATATGDNKLLFVEFYADGVLLERDKTYPYHVDWYPGQEGIHEVYTVARDDKGNRMTSDPLQVSIGYVETPKVRLVAPTGGLIDHQKFGTGAWPTFIADTTPGDARIWKVEFQVNTYERVSGNWRGNAQSYLNNRWQYTWDPRGEDGIYDAGDGGQGTIGSVTDDNVYADLPGVYEVRAIVTDRHLMTSLSNVEVFEIIKVDGSQIPVNNLTFPYRHFEDTNYYEGEEDNENDPVGVLESGSTELNATEILTMTTKSKYVLSSRAMDPDGALRGVQYTVDGANVHFQFLQNPMDGHELILHNHETENFFEKFAPYSPWNWRYETWLLHCTFVDTNSISSAYEDVMLDYPPYGSLKSGKYLVRIENTLQGTFQNFMKLLDYLSLDSDGDGYTDQREILIRMSGENQTSEFFSNGFDYLNKQDKPSKNTFTEESKFLARSSDDNFAKLFVFDPRGLKVTSSNQDFIHVAEFAEIPYRVSSNNRLQPYSHAYWEPKLEGDYTVQSIAVDWSGNVTPSKEVSTITVTRGEENPPIVYLSSFDTEQPINSSISLRANVSDFTSEQNASDPNEKPVNAIQYVGFLVNGRMLQLEQGPIPADALATNQGFSYLFLDDQPPFFTTLDLNETGRYEIFAFARDNEGNIVFSPKRDILVYAESPYELISGRVSGGNITISNEGRSGRRSAQTISGFNGESLENLISGKEVKFKITHADFSESETATFKVIDVNSKIGEFSVDGPIGENDMLMMSDQQNSIEIMEVYKVGSQIFFPVEQKVNASSLDRVEFYENGNLVSTDQFWPFAHTFTISKKGHLSITAISTDKNGLENVLERKIYVEDMTLETNNAPYGSLVISPRISAQWAQLQNQQINRRPNIVGKGSSVIAHANYSDLDGKIEQVEFYLNGIYKPQSNGDKISPHYLSFEPISSGDEGLVDLTAVIQDDSGNVVVESTSFMLAGTPTYPELKFEEVAGSNGKILQGETITLNVFSKSYDAYKLQTPGQSVIVGNPRQCLIVGNGQEIGYAVETGTATNNFTMEWNVDPSIAGTDGTLELIGLMGVDDGGTADFSPAQITYLGGNANPNPFSVLSTSPIMLVISQKNPFKSTKEAVSQAIEDLLNRSPSGQEIDEALSLITNSDLSSVSPAENPEFLSWVSENLVTRQSFLNIADGVGTYKTVVGIWPDKNDVLQAVSDYSAFPNYGNDGSGDTDQDGYSDNQERSFRTDPNDPSVFPQNGFKIGEYADSVLSSQDFLARHKPVPPLFGNDRFVRYEENRREFVNLLYKNKYGNVPTLQQTIQGAYRLAAFDPQSEEAQREIMLAQRQQLAMASMFGGGFGGQGNQGGNQQFTTQLLSGLLGGQQQNQVVLPTYANPEPAIIYISIFVLEEKLDNQDLIFGMPSAKNEFETVALMVNLWNENAGIISSAEVNMLKQLPTPNRISAIMKDERYRSRFPSVLRGSVDIAENWKSSDWLGDFYYNDDSYPWVYHSDFGWIYLDSTSDNDAWLYLPKIGWIWVSESTSEIHSDGNSFYAYKQRTGWLWFDFYESDSEQDIYFDYSTGSWSNYSK